MIDDRSPFLRFAMPGLLLAVLVGLPACRRFTKPFADKQVYGILDAKRPCVPELKGSLNIESHKRLEDAARGREAYLLDADAAVGLAMVASREFRTAREEVYLTALALTLAKREFDPLFDGGADAALEFDENGTRFDGGFGASVSKAFATGGSIVLGLASDFLRGLSSNPAQIAQSIISADMVIPLLRGSGRLVVLENLRQSERDTLYAMRDFARFQQELRVTVSSSVYRVVELQQTWQNEERAYESLLGLVDEQTLKGQAGKIPEFAVDQARQDLLASDDRRQRARRVYNDALDDLKFTLGIPMDVDVVVVRHDLEEILEEGPRPPPYPLDEAVPLAHERRLDLKNVRGRREDADRHVEVARNALLTQLDLVAGASVDTPPDRAFEFKQAEASGDFGLILDLPLERTAERNIYVRRIVAAMRARRALERAEDQIDRDVRTAYRRLLETHRSYEIQRVSVELAERRVESTGLLLQQGSATIRDRLEAEDARTRARNALTSAVVDYALAVLSYERDIGTLTVYAPDDELPPEPPPGFPAPVPSAPDVVVSDVPASDAAAAESNGP